MVDKDTEEKKKMDRKTEPEFFFWPNLLQMLSSNNLKKDRDFWPSVASKF